MFTMLQIAATRSLTTIRRALISIAISLCLLISGNLGWALPALAQPLVAPIAQSVTEQPITEQLLQPETSANPSSSQLFTENCAACHVGGGNIIRRGKTLKQKALKRYGYEQAEAIVSLITAGKGAMPAFGDRLSAEEISAIAQYVQTQAANDWK